MTPDSFAAKNLDRRTLLSWAAFGTTAATLESYGAGGVAAEPAATPSGQAAGRRRRMKKSINLWAFPYPQKMTLRQCLQLAKDAGFDAIELNYDLDSELSPKSGTAEFQAIRRMADEIGIAISGVCSFLFWPYPLTSNRPDERARGLELAKLMTQAAHDLGTSNLLVVPGAVCMPWREDHDPTPNDVCDQRLERLSNRCCRGREARNHAQHREHLFQRVLIISV